MGREPWAPTVRTMEPHEAHPLHLRWTNLRTEMVKLAAACSREGYQTAGTRLIRVVDTLPRDLPGVPRMRDSTASREATPTDTPDGR